MERQNRLADLKLVNKYYPPVGVANFSYPSPPPDSAMSRCDLPVGRSSVGSEASVPDMVDDRESVISTDEDNKSFYHLSGAELWDKFWEDPFWEANAEEAEREADGITQRLLNRNASYPALIPSPDEYQPKNQYFQRSEAPVLPEPVPSLTRPIAAAESPATSRPVTPKVSYSLFPRQTPTPPRVLQLSPRRPAITPRSTSLWANPDYNDSTASLNSLGRSSRVRKTRSDVPLAPGRSSWTTSSANLPAISIPPPPPPFDIPTKRDSSQSINMKQRFPVRPTRIRSDTLASQLSVTSAPRSSTIDLSLKHIISNPQTLLQAPPRPPRPFSNDRHSQPEPRKLPPPLLLHRCTTESDLPPFSSSSSSFSSSTSASFSSSSHRQSRAHVYAHTNPCTTPTMPSHYPPPPPPPPMEQPMSFFDVDSSDSEEEEGGASRFARRFARSFTSQVRARSASAAPRSRKGGEVARAQLRRARAETVGSPGEEEGKGKEKEKEEEVAGDGEGGKCDGVAKPPLLRKQRSEVFGKIFWGRR